MKFLLFSMAFVCASCVSMYVPSARNVPMFEEKGDFQACASLGNGLNVNTAYAFTNHLSIYASGLYANNKTISPEYWRIHKSADIALGFYANKKKMAFEVVSGYGLGNGFGKSKKYEPQDFFEWLFLSVDDEEAKGKYQKAFLQPSIGFRHKRAQFIGTFRFSYVDFNSIKISRYDYPVTIPKTNFYFFEPSFTIKFFPVKNTPSLFMIGQAGFNVEIDDQNSPEFGYSFLHYSIGIGLRLKKSSDH